MGDTGIEKEKGRTKIKREVTEREKMNAGYEREMIKKRKTRGGRQTGETSDLEKENKRSKRRNI